VKNVARKKPTDAGYIAKTKNPRELNKDGGFDVMEKWA